MCDHSEFPFLWLDGTRSGDHHCIRLILRVARLAGTLVRLTRAAILREYVAFLDGADFILHHLGQVLCISLHDLGDTQPAARRDLAIEFRDQAAKA